MTIVYALISRQRTVLAEYTVAAGMSYLYDCSRLRTLMMTYTQTLWIYFPPSEIQQQLVFTFFYIFHSHSILKWHATVCCL